MVVGRMVSAIFVSIYIFSVKSLRSGPSSVFHAGPGSELLVVRELLSVHRESQEHVARHNRDTRITGKLIHHASGNRCSCAVHRTAMRLDAINGFEIAGSIEVPNDMAVRGRVGAQMAIVRPGEYCSVDDTGRARLSGAAT